MKRMQWMADIMTAWSVLVKPRVHFSAGRAEFPVQNGTYAVAVLDVGGAEGMDHARPSGHNNRADEKKSEAIH